MAMSGSVEAGEVVRHFEVKVFLLCAEQFWNENRTHANPVQSIDLQSQVAFKFNIISCFCRRSTRTGVIVNTNVAIFKPLVLLFYLCLAHTFFPKDFLDHFNSFHPSFWSLRQNTMWIR